MGKITIKIDSHIQTQKEINDFTKDLFNRIKEDLIPEDVFVKENEFENVYDLKWKGVN